MDIADYIYPELVCLIPVLAVLGKLLKEAGFFADRWIPLALGCVAVLLAVGYLVGDGSWNAHALAAAATQGLLCAGTAVYGHQLIKQWGKKEPKEDEDE